VLPAGTPEKFCRYFSRASGTGVERGRCSRPLKWRAILSPSGRAHARAAKSGFISTIRFLLLFAVTAIDNDIAKRWPLHS
jgi:hypothetical protein